MNLELIRQEVENFNLPLARDVLLNPSVPNGVLISIFTVRDPAGRRTPSGKTLAQLKASLERLGAAVEYLLIDETSYQVEEGVRASLINSFPTLIRNSYVTVTDGAANVWVEKKKDLSAEDRDSLSAHIRTYAELFQMHGAVLHVMSDFNLATPIEVLKVIRKLAPADCEEVQKELQQRGYSVPSLTWINHRFDLLRKQGLIVRTPERTYALTSRALHQLGTIKSRRSPDISRLLALARRGS